MLGIKVDLIEAARPFGASNVYGPDVHLNSNIIAWSVIVRRTELILLNVCIGELPVVTSYTLTVVRCGRTIVTVTLSPIT